MFLFPALIRLHKITYDTGSPINSLVYLTIFSWETTYLSTRLFLRYSSTISCEKVNLFVSYTYKFFIGTSPINHDGAFARPISIISILLLFLITAFNFFIIFYFSKLLCTF